MKFVTDQTEEVIQSRKHLLELIGRSAQERRKFFIGEDQSRCLHVVDFSDEGMLLELHRGKRREGWISPVIPAREEVEAVLLQYFETGDLSDERLTKYPEWMEVSVFHPAVYFITGIGILGAILYFVWFRK